jgi:hypothetical protein|tara:strand:- start:140 stop:376 length:237 start_codon:yes stop_codon:yes gene_type:complete
LIVHLQNIKSLFIVVTLTGEDAMQVSPVDQEILDTIEDLRVRESVILHTSAFDIAEVDMEELVDVRSQLAIFGEAPKR